jgi:hypothetical protein
MQNKIRKGLLHVLWGLKAFCSILFSKIESGIGTGGYEPIQRRSEKRKGEGKGIWKSLTSAIWMATVLGTNPLGVKLFSLVLEFRSSQLVVHNLGSL